MEKEEQHIDQIYPAEPHLIISSCKMKAWKPSHSSGGISAIILACLVHSFGILIPPILGSCRQKFMENKRGSKHNEAWLVYVCRKEGAHNEAILRSLLIGSMIDGTV